MLVGIKANIKDTDQDLETDPPVIVTEKLKKMSKASHSSHN